MAFKGRKDEPEVTCTDERFNHLNICPTPWWTTLIRRNTIWECPKCERQYRLEWVAAGADAFKSWERYKPKANRPL